MPKFGYISKGYVKGPHTVCINPSQEKPILTYDSKDVIECGEGVKTSLQSPKYQRNLRMCEGNQYGELTPDVIRDPLWREGQSKTAKPRPNSPFKRAKVVTVVVRK